MLRSNPDSQNNAIDLRSSTLKGLAVNASPFNAVKLELAIILIISSIFYLLVSRCIESNPVQLLLYFSFAVVSSGWIIIRTKRIMTSLMRDSISPEKFPENNPH